MLLLLDTRHWEIEFLQEPRSDLSEAGKPRISLLQAFHISRSRFNRKRAPVAMTEKLVLVSYVSY